MTLAPILSCSPARPAGDALLTWKVGFHADREGIRSAGGSHRSRRGATRLGSGGELAAAAFQ